MPTISPIPRAFTDRFMQVRYEAVRIGALARDWAQWARATTTAIRAQAASDWRALSPQENAAVHMLDQFALLAAGIDERQLQTYRDAGERTPTSYASLDGRIRAMPRVIDRMPAGTYYARLLEWERDLRRQVEDIYADFPRLSEASDSLARRVARTWNAMTPHLPAAIEKGLETTGLKTFAEGYGSMLDGVGEFLRSVPLVALAVIAYVGWRAFKQ